MHWAASQPDLIDFGYEGTGEGVHISISQSANGNTLVPSDRTTTGRAIRAFGERSAILLTGRPRAQFAVWLIRRGRHEVHLLEGNTLVVTELSRLGRSLQDLITIVADLRRRNVGFRSLHEQTRHHHPPTDGWSATCSPTWPFLRELIAEGTSEGLDAARARGQRMTPDKIRMASELVGKEPVATIARLLGFHPVHTARVHAQAGGT